MCTAVVPYTLLNNNSFLFCYLKNKILSKNNYYEQFTKVNNKTNATIYYRIVLVFFIIIVISFQMNDLKKKINNCFESLKKHLYVFNLTFRSTVNNKEKTVF